MLTAPYSLLLLAAVILLAAVELHAQRQSSRAAAALGLPPARPSLPRLAAGSGAVLLLALAASQPVLGASTASYLRRDAEVYVTLDTSSSMLARASEHSSSRFSRANRAADRIIGQLPADLPVGVAAMPQDILPLVAPTDDRVLAESALHELALPNRLPTKTHISGQQATWFAQLTGLAVGHFFRPSVSKRVVVMLTDAEGPDFPSQSTVIPLQGRHIKLVVVRFGATVDRLWFTWKGRMLFDRGYRPNISDLAELQFVAKQSGGGFYSEHDLGAAIAKVRQLVGNGSDYRVGARAGGIALAPYLFLAALPLLAFSLAAAARRLYG